MVNGEKTKSLGAGQAERGAKKCKFKKGSVVINQKFKAPDEHGTLK